MGSILTWSVVDLRFKARSSQINGYILKLLLAVFLLAMFEWLHDQLYLDKNEEILS